MRLPDPLILGAIYGVSEVYLAFTRRSQPGAVSRDRHSLILLWTIIILSLWCGVQMIWIAPWAVMPQARALYLIGLFLFLGGLSLRWYAIGYLGRYFTVDVSISPEHRLVDSGPFRFIRHPTYTGAILAFIGLGLCFANWLSILFLSLPVIGALLWRIHIEEHALVAGLGEQYCAYMQRTKRLIPFIF